MDTCETTYKKKVVPILKKHDLEESSEVGRRTTEGGFSPLFEVEARSGGNAVEGQDLQVMDKDKG